MRSHATARTLVLIWFTVLASPLAWGLSLVSMFWLTHPVCQGLSRSVLILAGAICAAVSLAGAFIAAATLKRGSAQAGEPADDPLLFLLRLAAWSGLIFALVIGLSLVPTAMLTPCPV
jgi:hypothetical protein